MKTAEDTAAAITHLGFSALFGALGEDDCRSLVRRMRRVDYDAGTSIFSRGDRANGIFLVLAGVVRLSILAVNGREISLSLAPKGTIFGEIAALDGGERSADATAITAIRTMLLPQADFSALMRTNPRLTEAVIRFLCARLRYNADKLEAVALHALDVRVARYFLALIEERSPGVMKGVAPLDLSISQAELGLMVGATRPKVNAALASLKSQGALRQKGGDIVCDIAALRRCAAYED